MLFETFTQPRRNGGLHRRRAIAYIVAACTLASLGMASARLRTEEKPPEREPEPVDVTLEEKIKEEIVEKPKEPEPPSPPPVEVPKHIAVTAAPPPPPVATPDADAKVKLDEADPSKDKGASAGGAGSTLGATGSAKPAAPALVPVEPPPCGATGQICCSTGCNPGLLCEAAVCRAAPPPPPKPAGPMMVSEDDIPAKGLSTPAPGYPPAARSEGIQGVVVVRLTINERGEVTDAKIVKGDVNFDDAVLAVVKSWTYEPAKHLDGTSFLSTKTVKIPFKIK